MFDIHFTVSDTGRYTAALIDENIDSMLIVFGYLKHCIKCSIVWVIRFLEDYVEIGIDINWSEIYPDAVD